MKKLNEKISFFWFYLTLNLFLLFAGEVYFRISSFGIKGLDVFKFFPYSDLQRVSYLDEGLMRFLPGESGYLYGAPFRTNSLGLWEEKDYTLRKPQDTLRIAFFGESFTLGAGVAQENNFASILRKKLSAYMAEKASGKDVEAINFAMPGDDRNNALIRRLSGVVKEYSPDVVVIGITSNFFPIGKEDVSPSDFFGAEEGPGRDNSLLGQIISRSFVINSILAFKDNIQGYLMRYGSGPAKSLGMVDARFGRERIRGYFTRIERAVEGKRVKVVIFLVRKLFSLDNAGFHKELQDNLRSVCGDFGYYFVNTYPSSYYGKLDTGDLIVYPLNEHPNELAHAIFGDILYSFFRDNLTSLFSDH